MKHDKARHEKDLRNEKYGQRYRQLICKNCKHRSSKPGSCRVCGGQMKAK